MHDIQVCSRLNSGPPLESRVLPIKVLLLRAREASQFRIDILLGTLTVVDLHEEVQTNRADQDRARRRQIEPVANGEVGCIGRQERPSRDETADIAKHHDCANRSRSCSVRHDVCGCLGVTESAEGESTCRDDKGGTVADLGLCLVSRQEHDVANHHQWCGGDEQVDSLVNLGADQRKQNREESPNHVSTLVSISEVAA